MQPLSRNVVLRYSALVVAVGILAPFLSLAVAGVLWLTALRANKTTRLVLLFVAVAIQARYLTILLPPGHSHSDTALTP